MGGGRCESRNADGAVNPYLAATLALELAISFPRLRPWAPKPIDPVRRPWFWAGLGSFVVANAVWNVSHTGGPWCSPHSLLQGHALWHLLSALAVWCFYLYFLAERGVPAGTEVGRPGGE